MNSASLPKLAAKPAAQPKGRPLLEEAARAVSPIAAQPILTPSGQPKAFFYSAALQSPRKPVSPQPGAANLARAAAETMNKPLLPGEHQMNGLSSQMTSHRPTSLASSLQTSEAYPLNGTAQLTATSARSSIPIASSSRPSLHVPFTALGAHRVLQAPGVKGSMPTAVGPFRPQITFPVAGAARSSMMGSISTSMPLAFMPISQAPRFASQLSAHSFVYCLRRFKMSDYIMMTRIDEAYNFKIFLRYLESC